MAALPGGGHHTLGPLDTDGIGGCGKAAAIGGQGAAVASMNGGGDGRRTSVVLVKLTDASLRSLEDYVRRRQARRSHHLSRRGGGGGHASPSSEETAAEGAPAIRFPSGQHELGTISIPLGGNGKQAEYSFSLSSLEDAPTSSSSSSSGGGLSSYVASSSAGVQGSFECLSSRAGSSMESIGTLQEKLQVKASVNDSYSTFEQKMLEVNQEKEKRTTQLLEREPSSRVAPRGLILTPASGSSGGMPNVIPRKYQQQHRPHPARSAIGGGGGGSRRQHHSYPHHHHHHHHHNHHANQDLMRRPLKERIIHLLAVRPYKKPELLARVARDGIHDKDKRNITAILKQVSAMKDNTYSLLRHLWNDVSEDWPFYSEQERQSFRRRKPQNLTPPCSDGSTSSSGHSPASTHPASPPHTSSAVVASPTSSSSGSEKRPYGGYDDGSPAAKRKRVSNYVRPPDLRVNGGGGGDYLNGGGHSPGGGGRLQPSPSSRTSPLHHAVSRLGRSPPMSRLSPGGGGVGGSPGRHYQQHNRAVIQQQHERAPSPHSRPPRQSPPPQHSPPTPPSTTDQRVQGWLDRNFSREFPPIGSRQQRLRYKEEFNKNYERYLTLHKKLDLVSRRFAKLEEMLQQQEPNTDSYRNMKQRIVSEYAATHQESTYVEAKEEFQYLHEKLAFIKKLVGDYDVLHPKKD